MDILRPIPGSRMKKYQTSPPYSPYSEKGERDFEYNIEDEFESKSEFRHEIESRSISSLVEKENAHGFQSEVRSKDASISASESALVALKFEEGTTLVT